MNLQVLVPEPSPVDTVNILRGIKEKYESFHGVRIADRALVVAAELSHRYIQHRFLPDKVRTLPSPSSSGVLPACQIANTPLPLNQSSLAESCIHCRRST